MFLVKLLTIVSLLGLYCKNLKSILEEFHLLFDWKKMDGRLNKSIGPTPNTQQLYFILLNLHKIKC